MIGDFASNRAHARNLLHRAGDIHALGSPRTQTAQTRLAPTIVGEDSNVEFVASFDKWRGSGPSCARLGAHHILEPDIGLGEVLERVAATSSQHTKRLE